MDADTTVVLRRHWSDWQRATYHLLDGSLKDRWIGVMAAGSRYVTCDGT